MTKAQLSAESPGTWQATANRAPPLAAQLATTRPASQIPTKRTPNRLLAKSDNSTKLIAFTGTFGGGLRLMGAIGEGTTTSSLLGEKRPAPLVPA
jgi:hypothetical protein